jgi:hypothetical protein
MHAIFVNVTINDGEAATNHLRQTVVPQVSQAPGFVSGSWVRIEGGNNGRATIICESEDAARGLAGQLAPPPDNSAQIDSIEIGEVVERA